MQIQNWTPQTKHALIRAFCMSAVVFVYADTQTSDEAQDTYELTEFVIKEQQTANIMPVTTYDTPISNLEFNPLIDFQSRNMAEAQGDITIRGGIFENTGFRIGSATLIDPQTGHYFAEIPIAPEMLTAPEVLIAGENALYGFNSTVGTISYGWTEIQNGGSLTVGAGDHGLNFQRIHHGYSTQAGIAENWSWGAEIEYSRSESDGTIEFGDHDFDRVTGRMQLVGPNSQTDFFAGYQHKFFGWPEMYAAPFGSNETENLKTRLLIINHRILYHEGSYLEASAYYRRHSDHYIFNRSSPNNDFIHETDVSSIGLAGRHELNDAFGIHYAGQFAADEIDSAALTFGDFDSRKSFKVSLLPDYRISFKNNSSLTLRAGGSYDDTNRDSSEFSGIADITWEKTHTNGSSGSVYLSYTETSQVVGYTALNSNPAGFLFGGDPDLERETSRNIELGGALTHGEWMLQGAVFYRWDDDLVDWTYSSVNINNRSANPVDIETFGLELLATKRWKTIEAIASYAYLDKTEDYGDDSIEGSFYALNYAKHRITLGLIWAPIDQLKFSIDNEWRSQQENPARSSDDEALFTHLTLTFYPPKVEGLELFTSIDNAWNDDFEEVPGTPGRGDQVAIGMTFRW